jgi:hypothetical protein
MVHFSIGLDIGSGFTENHDSKDQRGRLPARVTDLFYAFPLMAPGSSGAIIVASATSTKGAIVPVWAWILLIGGVIGMLGAALIVAAVFEITSMPFRKWETLP